jgi:hypothetical protein
MMITSPVYDYTQNPPKLIKHSTYKIWREYAKILHANNNFIKNDFSKNNFDSHAGSTTDNYFYRRGNSQYNINTTVIEGLDDVKLNKQLDELEEAFMRDYGDIQSAYNFASGFIIAGLDILIKSNNDIVLLEANTAPQMYEIHEKNEDTTIPEGVFTDFNNAFMNWIYADAFMPLHNEIKKFDRVKMFEYLINRQNKLLKLN